MKRVFGSRRNRCGLALAQALGLALALAPTLPVAAPVAAAADCSMASRGYVPLTDLGAGIYHGHPGGLYPGGSNLRPAAHDAAGIAIANSIVPLDTLGQPDAVNGRVVLISVGMSNCTQEFSTFVPRAMSDPARNPRLLVIDCAQGGQAAADLIDPNAPYWSTVAARLRAAGSSPAQAQAVWIKEAMRGPRDSLAGGSPAAADSLRWFLAQIVRNIHARLPNVRLTYLTSRIYAGYATSTLNPEPHAYESGFAVKWLVESQIAGDSLNYDPGHGPVEAPWIAWGPYLWADGLTPRGDGLTWACTSFADDGTHPSTLGRGIVADSLLAFFKRDATTVPWFLAAGTVGVSSTPGGDAPRVALVPNPTRRSVEIAFTAAAGTLWRLEIFDVVGRRVRDLAAGLGSGALVRTRWDGALDAGARAPAGYYWARLRHGTGMSRARIVLIGSDPP